MLYATDEPLLHAAKTWCSHRTHRDLQLRLQNLERAFNASLSERCKPPTVGASPPNGVRTESDSLEDFSPAPKSPIDENGNPATDHFAHFRQRLDGRSAALFAAAAMIGDNDAISSV